MGSRARWAIALLLPIAACQHRPAPAVEQHGPAAERMPALRLDRVLTASDKVPFFVGQPIAVGPTGVIAFSADEGDGRLATLVDSTGAIAQRVGVHGEGPGEVRGPIPLWVDDSTVVFGDLYLPRLTVIGFDGLIRRSVPIAMPVLTALPAAGGNAIELISAARGMVEPVQLSTIDGHVQHLMSGADSFIRAASTGMVGQGEVRQPVLGRWSDGYVIGDGWHYRLALYGWDGVRKRVLGRDLPPAILTPARIDELIRRAATRVNAGRFSPVDSIQERQAVADEPRPFFGHTHHLGLDRQGRIWVFGVTGDSGFADLFSATRFLGRLALACPAFEGSAAVAGDRVAIICAADRRMSDVDAMVQLYRIVDDSTR